MSQKDRTVIERLEDIENKIPSFEYRAPRPISEVIGRPFADYLNDATIYGYESDERKFKRAIKKQKTSSIICLSMLIAILIFDIIILVLNKKFEWVLVTMTTLGLLGPGLTLITLLKQRNKQPMRSFWNIKKFEFYLTKDGEQNRLVKEESKGTIFYVIFITKIIAILFGYSGFLFYLFASFLNNMIDVLFWITLVLSFISVLLSSTTIRIRTPYYYFDFLIETEDSYVTYPHLDYFKK